MRTFKHIFKERKYALARVSEPLKIIRKMSVCRSGNCNSA